MPYDNTIMSTPLHEYILFVITREGDKGAHTNLTFYPYSTLYKIISPYLYHESSVRHAVKKLETTGFVEKMQREGQLYVSPTKQGYKNVSDVHPQAPTKQHPPSEWWQVMFDVPESKRAIRDEIRSHLVAMGFKNWYRSVYIYPDTSINENQLMKTLQNKQWRPFLVVAKMNKIVLGPNSQELLQQLWSDDEYEQLDTTISDVQETISMLSKRAINNYQKRSYHEKGQHLGLQLYEALLKINHSPVPYAKANTLIPLYNQLTETLLSIE